MVFKFTIDTVLNKYVPYNRLNRLPKPIRRVLGSHHPKPVADYWIWIEILVSSFCGIALLEGVFKSHTVFTSHHVPMIIASYGATAILCFNAHQAPLAQPRSILMGHFVASLIGVCIQKLFLLSAGGRHHYWASGALSVCVASVAMSILNCVHPPAGASALLPSVDEHTREMSWWYLPVQLILSVLIICVAMITGNVIRKFPAYWWTPAVLKPSEKKDEEKELEKELKKEEKSEPKPKPKPVPRKFESDVHYVDQIDYVKITANGITIPSNLNVEDLNFIWLELVRQLIASSQPTPLKSPYRDDNSFNSSKS